MFEWCEAEGALSNSTLLLLLLLLQVLTSDSCYEIIECEKKNIRLASLRRPERNRTKSN